MLSSGPSRIFGGSFLTSRGGSILASGEVLLRSALALADFNKLPSEPIAAIRDGRGHGDRAMDLLGLSSLYKSAWPAIERHTAVPFDLVLEAARLGDEILTAIGQGEQAYARASEATLMRNRAFDLAERVRLAAVWAEAGGERGRTGERWARVEGGRELQPRGPRANRERETVTRSFLTKPTAEASRECRATAGVAPEPRPGQPKPRAARCGLVLAALTVVVAAACHDDDRRSERELCVSAQDFSADEVCGTPDDVLRLHRLNFLCSPTDSSCRLENVRGPFPRAGERGEKRCCYTYTLVHIDNHSYVD